MSKDLIVPVYTSYFSNKVIHTNDYTTINIARRQPNWLTDEFPTYHNAVPTWLTLENWRNSDKGKEAMIEYIKRYYSTMLNIYGEDSPYVHLDNLVSLTSTCKAKRGDKPVVFTCYEVSGKFCHRIIYATYIKLTTGVVIPELGYSPVQPSEAQSIITDTLHHLIKGR